MATYVIGDIHGCYDQLVELLDKINFTPNDVLWFSGDLINGGPKPAEVIRFIKSLGSRHICILGNHDLVLLALGCGKVIPQNDRKIGFEPFFNAHDHIELLEWLRMRPLIHYDDTFKILLVHAGVLPQWDLTSIKQYAAEVELLLHNQDYEKLYENMFGNTPDAWSNQLTGWDRVRFIINCFTRMRFCTPSGQLDFTAKGNIDDGPSGFYPWFKIPRNDNLKIIFGHWAALLGKTNVANAIAIDTGCVWGNSLSAYCLETQQVHSVKSLINQKP